jgi:hypothetical protein
MRRYLWIALVLGACAANPPAAVAPVSSAAQPSGDGPAALASPNAAERAALRREGLAAYEQQAWATCADLLARAGDWYDAACCRARGGEPDLAFALLERVMADGFRDVAHLDRDPDLASLRADPRWSTAVAAASANHQAYLATVEPELLALYQADQADRARPYDQIDWKTVGPRDAERRRRVDELVAAGRARVADDYYHAAMVYQHGENVAEIRRARELALAAVKLEDGHARARWLAAAALDRELMYQDQPQKYGTQYKRLDGRWVLWKVDPATTDAERAAWGVPSLAEAEAQATAMNAR